jgi:hypothetical protein
MSRWVGYCILGVRFNTARTHIDSIRAAPNLGKSLGPVREILRADVVMALKQGVDFITMFRSAGGSYTRGTPMFLVTINGTDYIQTVRDGIASDKLDGLPEF